MKRRIFGWNSKRRISQQKVGGDIVLANIPIKLSMVSLFKIVSVSGGSVVENVLMKRIRFWRVRHIQRAEGDESEGIQRGP